MTKKKSQSSRSGSKNKQADRLAPENTPDKLPKDTRKLLQKKFLPFEA